ncbi:DUF6531 domain-containing protein [Micromonospora sp. WMMD882]|uniref:RHS repeat-associated core domain-containing protein n=1 Tax=Micromonospora sp. WMMD882 TaxID=3015151 RepID=UPI00248AD34B|nr:RHS repeat-associated core domain-containing protein [Micromonospora sp. WMMD882]WBB77264.1 DUF6531 domain-containing protein [Micromonospora sp. WMMD882]
MRQRSAVVGVAVAVAVASALVAPTGSRAEAAPGGNRVGVASNKPSPAVESEFSPRSGSKTWLFDSPKRVTSPSTAGAAPSVPKGTGPVRNGTEISFSLTDRLTTKVNVASGNLLLTSTELTLPGVAQNLTVGASFNSLLLGSDLEVGAHGPGWRTRSGVDVKLYPADDGSVTYAAADGVIGKFTASGSGYTSPGEFKATLADDGAGWKLTEHGDGRKLFFTSAGLLDRTEDRNGNVTDFAYSAGKMTTVTSDRGVTSARTATVSYTGDRLVRYRQSDGYGTLREVSYEYDSGNRLSAIQSAASSRRVTFEYDTNGDLVKIWPKDDAYVTITYDGQHRVTSVKQVLNHLTGDGVTTRFAYPTSSRTLVADARQDLSQPVSAVPHTVYDHNADKRVTGVTDPAGNSRSKQYTPYQDVLSSVSPEGAEITNTFGANAGESITKSVSPTGASAEAAYANAATSTNPTANFQPSSSIDTQGNSSTYTYNGAGNRTATADALAAEAEVEYNTNGTVKNSTDPGNTGNPTTYTYDSNKQVTKVTPPTGNGLAEKTFTYDNLGRLKTVTDGCVTTYDYSNDDRITSISYSGCAPTAGVTFSYGRAGNVISRTDATGTTTWVHDNLNRTRQRTDAGGTLDYRYDAVGNLTELTDGRGSTKYYYNTRNWLVRMDTAGGTRYNFSYDKDGNRENTWFATNEGNSAYALRVKTVYDRSDRPTRITATRNSASPATVFDVSYCHAKYVAGQGCSTDEEDDTGLRQWQKDETTGAVTQFSYDDGNRLTKATNHHGKTYEYGYDTNGNRTSVKVDGVTTQTLTFNTANQVTTSNNTYDGRGNQTKASAPSIGTLNYNAAKQLTSTSGGGGSANYSYAGTDQVELTAAGTTTLRYGIEDQHGMPWLQSWNPNGTPVYAERDGLGTPLGLRIANTDHAYVLDGLGSVVAIVKADGTVSARYTYEPYGKLLTSDEYNLPHTNLIRYAGGTYDQTSTLTKFGQRWYNPVQGRFTQQDNLSFLGNPQHGNRYAYAGCNPVNYVDPTGNDFSWCSAGFFAAGAATAVGLYFAPLSGGTSLAVGLVIDAALWVGESLLC